MLEGSDGKGVSAAKSDKGKKGVESRRGGSHAVRESGDGLGEGWECSRAHEMQYNAAHVRPEALLGGGAVLGAASVHTSCKKKAGRRTGDTRANGQEAGLEGFPCLTQGAQQGGAARGGGGGEKPRKKRRSRADKRAAAADAGAARKKSKQGILGAPKTAEVAGVAYDSGQDSD